jgi:hypothetical protein
MKIKDKPFTLIRNASDGSWLLCERVRVYPDGQTVVSGKIIDVTKSVAPALAGTNEYIRRLEAGLVAKIRENFSLRGLTADQNAIMAELNRLKEMVK